MAVPGFDNYEVSNYGRVCNVKRGTDLQPRTDPAGFQTVALYNNGVRREFGVHRLVAMVFFADFEDGIEIKHINEDKTENTVRNLTLGRRLKIRVRIRETGEEFDSLTACAAHIGGNQNGVSQVVNQNDKTRKHHSYLGYTFEVIDA